MSNEENVFGKLARAVLIILNATLVLFGTGVVYLSQRLAKYGWVQALETAYKYTVEQILIGVLVFGIAVILIGLIGCTGAWLQHRVLLIAYHTLLFLALLFFIAILVAAIWLQYKAKEWKTEPYPISRVETDMSRGFDRLYCYAQVPYYCEEATVQETLDTFQVSRPLSSAMNMNALCALAKMKELEGICALCRVAQEQRHVYAVLKYANRECPRDKRAVLWCKDNFRLDNAGTLDSNVGVSPFLMCRDRLYSSLRTYGKVSVALSLTICVLLLFACLCVWILRQRMRCVREKECEKNSLNSGMETSNASYLNIKSENTLRARENGTYFVQHRF